MTSAPRDPDATLHPHAAGLYVLGDPAWRVTLERAGWTWLVPFVGWHMVLGFRKRLIAHLASGPDVLPEWSGHALRHLVDGLKAGAVIFGWMSPVYAVAFGLALARGWDPTAASIWVPLFFLALPPFLPLSLPVALVMLSIDGRLRPVESAALLLAYAGVVFVIPAAFLQVSRTGRFRSAFRVDRVVAFLRRRLVPYTRAWIASGAFAFLGHVVLPICPAGPVWAYCGIMFVFNEVLVANGEHGRGGWLERARSDARWAPASFGLRAVDDARGEAVRVLDLGFLSAPLPWRSRRARTSAAGAPRIVG